ncbi:MAG: hypothetical protein WBO70_08090 [Erysipelotrichaceae bacterium]
MKKITSILIVMIIMISSISDVYADDEKNELNQYINYIETTELYLKYKSQITGLEVLRKVNTEEGIRYTVQYSLNKSEKGNSYMVLVSDKSFNMIEALITVYEEKLVSIINLKNEVSTNVYIQPRKPVYQCTKNTCVRYGPKMDIQIAQGCSAIVGQACDVLKLIGEPILYVICKSGVWIACNVNIELKACLRYVEELTVCGL